MNVDTALGNVVLDEHGVSLIVQRKIPGGHTELGHTDSHLFHRGKHAVKIGYHAVLKVKPAGMAVHPISPAVKAHLLQTAIAVDAAAYAALTEIVHLAFANAHAQACRQDVHLTIQQNSDDTHGVHRLAVDRVQGGVLFQQFLHDIVVPLLLEHFLRLPLRQRRIVDELDASAAPAVDAGLHNKARHGILHQ